MTEHYHIWSSNVMGTEYANAVFLGKIDACETFLSLAREIAKRNENVMNELNIEMVVNSLDESNGMYAGIPSFVVVISKCSGACFSSTWN